MSLIKWLSWLSDQLLHHKEHPRPVPIWELFTSLLKMHTNLFFVARINFNCLFSLSLLRTSLNSSHVKLWQDQIHCGYTILDSHSQDLRRAVETCRWTLPFLLSVHDLWVNGRIHVPRKSSSLMMHVTPFWKGVVLRMYFSEFCSQN